MDKIEFRLKESGDGMKLKSGDEVTVMMVYEPSQTVIYDNDIPVEEG